MGTTEHTSACPSTRLYTFPFTSADAPWSHDCRKLLPIWDQLGEKYQNRKDIIIAKIDVTANDILSVVLDRYPFFRLFPAGADYQVRSFRGRMGWHSCTLRGGWLGVRAQITVNKHVRKESFKQEGFAAHLHKTEFFDDKTLIWRGNPSTFC